MISEFSARPKPTNNNAKYAFISSLSLALAVFIFSLTLEKYKGAVGMIALVLLTFALFIYTRYIAVLYFYDITFDGEGKPIFVVRQKIGKRDSTLCRIDLYSIKKIEKETAEERKRHKTPVGYLKYVYSPTLFPSVTYRITVLSGYEKSEVIIECPDEFANTLELYAKEASEYIAEEDYE